MNLDVTLPSNAVIGLLSDLLYNVLLYISNASHIFSCFLQTLNSGLKFTVTTVNSVTNICIYFFFLALLQRPHCEVFPALKNFLISLLLQQLIIMSFSDFTKTETLKNLNDYLVDKSYIDGYV